MAFKEVIKKHIAPIVLAASISGSVIAMNPLIVSAESCDESVVNTFEEKKLTSSLLNNREEAENWIKDRVNILNQAYDITNVKLYLYKGKTTEIETKPIDERYDNEIEALERLKELNEDVYYASDVSLNVLENDTEVIYNLVGRMFRTTHEDRYKVEIGYVNKTKEQILSECENCEEEVSKLDESPKTGDDSNIEMYSMMLMSSTAGLAYMASKVKRKVIHR